MEISDIRVHPLAYPLESDSGYGSARGIVHERVATLVEVETTDGTIGWGESFGPPRTMATLIDEVLRDMVVGMDSWSVDSLVERVTTGLYHFGSSGLLLAAVSGIDIAIWDILGKVTGEPIHRLLGGPTRSSVTPYASTMYFTESAHDPSDPMQVAVEEGFAAAKIKIGRGVAEDEERTRIARETLGDDAFLMVDVNGNYRADQAIELARTLEPYDVHWLEEPVPPESIDGYREVREQTGVSVAGGEAVYSRFGFDRLLSNRAVDIIQPDVCKCGGLSEAAVIAEMATVSNTGVSAHCWTSGVGLAASLQYAATVPAYPHSGNAPEPYLFEVDRAENALRSELVTPQVDPSGGDLVVPERPGLGIKINREALGRYRVEA